MTFKVTGSYADPTADVGEGVVEHGWDHGLGEIVTALIDAGLRIEALVEHPFVDWSLDFLVEEPPGSDTWRLPPESKGELPLDVLAAGDEAARLAARAVGGRGRAGDP